MDESPAYYAIIPANVRYDKNLTANSKLLYGEITALCNAKGYCWAKNDYFAKLYGVSKTSISKWIKQLIDGGYISSELIYKEGTKEIDNRYLRIVNGGMQEKLNTPIEEKLKDNNTLINNTININTSCHKYETCDLESSQLMFNLMIKNNPNCKQPNFDKWSEDIRKIRTIDGYTTEQINYLIKWTQQDSFWKSNILSPAKLRKQFDGLVIKMKADKERANKQQQQYQKPINPWEEYLNGELSGRKNIGIE